MRLEGEYTITSACKTEEELRSLVQRHRPAIPLETLRVLFHENTSTMVSLSRHGETRTLRVHWLFTKAPRSVLEAIVRSFFARRRAESADTRLAILEFIDQNRGLTLSACCARELGASRGRVYDLEEVGARVRARYLADCPVLRIGWSRRVTPCLMGKWIQMPAGSPNVVVVNRLLDNRKVPAYYLEYIVFHEMLHELIPIRRSGGRWVHHPSEFRRKERQFPLYERAQTWETRNIGRLFNEHLRKS